MEPRAIVDTGFLIALLNRNDSHHFWAKGALDRLPGPWLTCESCVSESVFLLEHAGKAAVEKLLGWMEQGLLMSEGMLPQYIAEVREEMFRYRDRWVDLADASVVVLSDRHPELPVAGVDRRDFDVYFRRRKGRLFVAPMGHGTS